MSVPGRGRLYSVRGNQLRCGCTLAAPASLSPSPAQSMAVPGRELLLLDRPVLLRAHPAGLRRAERRFPDGDRRDAQCLRDHAVFAAYSRRGRVRPLGTASAVCHRRAGRSGAWRALVCLDARAARPDLRAGADRHRRLRLGRDYRDVCRLLRAGAGDAGGRLPRRHQRSRPSRGDLHRRRRRPKLGLARALLSVRRGSRCRDRGGRAMCRGQDRAGRSTGQLAPPRGGGHTSEAVARRRPRCGEYLCPIHHDLWLHAGFCGP